MSPPATVPGYVPFFRNRHAWEILKFGGRPLRAVFTKVGNVTTKDAWKAQKNKESSGSTNVFGGTTKEPLKITLVAHDLHAELEIRRLWKLLEPVPGLGGSTGGAVKPPSGYAAGGPVGSPPAAGSAAGTAPKTGLAGGSAGGADDKSKGATTPDPGPRPPTISIDYPPFRYHGITAVARQEWTGPELLDDGGMQFELTFIVQDPPKPAGAGAMGPTTPGSEFSGGGAGAANGTPATPQAQATKNANQGAAGT